MKKERIRFCYLGKDGLLPFLGIIIFLVVLVIMEKYCDFNYLNMATAVQNQDYSKWHSYLGYGFITVIVGFIAKIVKIFSGLWLEKIQKLNFFAHFDGILQTGRKKVCLKKFELESAKVNTIIVSIYTFIVIFYTVYLMYDRKLFGKSESFLAVIILILGLIFGIIRGNLQFQADSIRTEIQTRQELLSNHSLISSNILEEHLKVIGNCYLKQRRKQVVKNAFQHSGDVLKMLGFVISMWTLVGKTENPYSYSYAIFLVYGYIIDIGINLSEILESLGKVYRFSKDQEIQNLLKFDMQREKTIIAQAKNVYLDNFGLTVCPEFTANVSHTNRPDDFYSIPKPLSIKTGEIVKLSGDNQTGKSRFNRLIKDLFPESTIMYEANTSISRILAENFVSESIPLDYALIRRLSEELYIEDRFTSSEESFMKLEFNEELNSASFQLVLIVQILYFSIKGKEVNPNKTQLIIFDEILSNIAQENIQNVVKVIKEELQRIGACVIIVSHSHSEIISELVDKNWIMKNDGSNTIFITEN